MAFVMEDPQTKEELRNLVESGEHPVVFEMGDTPVEKLLQGKVLVDGPQDPDAEEHWHALVKIDEEFHIVEVVA